MCRRPTGKNPPVPAAVQRIGNDVVSTPGITAFEVEEGNVSYRSVDGVLYDGELKELLRCPDHWPCSCLRVPEGVERIFGCACWGCIFLASIRIPASVNYIDSFLFMSQIGGRTITIDVDDGNAWYRIVDGVLFSKDMTELLRCPVSRSGEYRIPPTVRAIGNFSFDACRLLTRIIVPASVEFEGQFAWGSIDAKIVREGAASNLFAAAADKR